MIKRIEGGLLGSSVYIVYTEESKRAIIVDCGVPVQEITAFIAGERLSVDYIVLTHGHFDHVDYIDRYVNEFPDAKILCHVDELKVLLDPEANLSPYIATSKAYSYPYETLKDCDEISIGENDSITFKIIHSPGHLSNLYALRIENKMLNVK